MGDVSNKDGLLPVITDEAGLHDLPRLLERLHRRFLDVVRIELIRLGQAQVSPVQALMVMTIGDGEMTARQLIDRGYYLGSNASGNLRALVETGHVERLDATLDRRVGRLRLTAAGLDLCRELRRVELAHLRDLSLTPSMAADLRATYRSLRRLERTWADVIRYDAVDME